MFDVCLADFVANTDPALRFCDDCVVRAPILAPMLASAARDERFTPGYWAFEPKLDGWRIMVAVDEDGVCVRTRNGRDITHAVPECQDLREALHGHAVVLDGELVAGAGRPDDFYRIIGRVGARRPASTRAPLTFAAFDLLFLDGESVCESSYADRRKALAELSLQGDHWTTVASFEGAIEDVFTACVLHDLEGLVAKRLSSRYRPGQRSRDWVKVKTTCWREEHAPRRHDRVG